MGSSSAFDGSSHVLDSFWISTSSSPSFQGDPVKGSASMVDFQKRPQENGNGGFFSSFDKDENNGESYDPCFHQSEKKRRLRKDQVQFLEKSFEVDNKLEPDRKVKLAKDIGLQPRQVAIWYQNRRARYKSKQLEKDYDSLKQSYDKLKVDYDNLLKENENLRNEVESLKEKMLVCEKRKVGLEPANSLDVEAKPIENSTNLQVMVCKQEDSTSLESRALDSESPHKADGNFKSVFESVDSSSVFEPDYSDISQDDENGFCRTMLLPDLPMLETESFDEIYVDHCNLEDSVEDEQLLFWTNVFDV